jgi:hypothetical protein
MKMFNQALAAAAFAAVLPAHAYVATQSGGAVSSVGGIATETFSDAPVFARTGGAVFNSTTPGATLTGQVYAVTGISVQPQKGGTYANDAWFSVGGGQTATFSFLPGTDYIGFLWGSIDTYNTVTFYDGAVALATFTGGTGGLAANQATLYADTYFNFFAPSITSMSFASLSNAFEIDNLSARTAAPFVVNDVPEPGALALLAAAFGAAAVARRRLRR